MLLKHTAICNIRKKNRRTNTKSIRNTKEKKKGDRKVSKYHGQIVEET